MGTISRITTFSTGDTLTASDLNGEFDNIISTANGSINADNLGVTAGQASASKAIVLDANKDFANVTTSNQIRNLTISGSLKIGTTFLPDAAGGADLGSTSLEWGDVYVADDKYLYMGSDQNIKIGYDETTTDSLAISAIEGAGLAITLRADEGDDAGDEWKLNVADGGVVTFGNDIASAGTYVTHLTLTPHATVASSTLALAGGLTVAGATQANSTVTVGVDDQGYDVKLFGDTASAYLMWDTSADKLLTAGGATIDIVKDKLLIGGVAVTTTAAELNLLDTASAGTVVASKAVVVDSNKDIASFRNVTLTGELDAATGDFSGDVDVDGTLEADAITLGGTALGSLYSPIAGSSSIVTVGTIGTGTWQGTAIALAYGGTGLVGATDGKIVIADGSGAPVLLDVGSSTAITVLGTVATGTWQATKVASAYLDDDTAHLTTTQTFSGAKTFSAAAQFSNTVTVGVNDTGYDVKFFGATAGSSLLWDESADDLILTNAGIAVGSDATGDLYYRNASGFLARLGVGSDGQVLTSTGTLPNWEAAAGGGSFSGPGSSTDNAVVRFNGTGGATGQNSGLIVDDSNNVTGAANITLSGELDAATGDFSGIIDVAGAATLASLVCTAGGTFGGGYGATGATISTAGVGQFNGALTTDGALTATGDISFDGGTFVFNESGADKDFRIEGDSQANLFVADASTDRIGIGTAAPDGPLHIMSASAGTVTADSNADEFVIEGSANTGMTILSGSGQAGVIVFGRENNNNLGQFGYHQGNEEMFWGRDDGQQMVLNSNGRLGIATTAPAHTLHSVRNTTDADVFAGSFKDTTSSYQLQVHGTSGAVTGTHIENYMESSSPADGDFCGLYSAQYKDSGGNKVVLGTFGWYADDVTAGTIDSKMEFKTVQNNAAKIAYLTAAGVWTDASAAAGKEYLGTRQEVWPDGILAKIKTLNVSKYQPADQPEAKPVTETHVSPTAEDFWDALQIGSDPRAEKLNKDGENTNTPTLAAKDLGGVALVAIQELLERVEALESA